MAKLFRISAPALAKLCERGALVALSQVTALPFADAAFDLVCALSELSRVAKSGRQC